MRGSLLLKFFIFGCAFLPTLEILARFDDRVSYGAPLFNRYASDMLREEDPEGISRNVPNARFEKWRNNEAGFRGPSLSKRKSGGVKRIFCMGTSETYGLYENPEKEWPRQLAKLLRTRPVEIVNASTPGLNLESYQRYIEKYLLPYDPDTIILLINPLRYFALLERTLNRQCEPSESQDTKRNRNPTMTVYITAHSRIIPKIRQAVVELLPHSLKREYRRWKMKREIEAIEAFRLGHKAPMDVIPDGHVSAFEDELQTLIHFLQYHKTDVILSTYPMLLSEDNIKDYEEFFLDSRRFCVELSLSGMIGALNEANAVIKAVANEYGLGFVDNYSKITKDTAYFADNLHYTDLGASLVAQNFADFIVQSLSEENDS